MYVYRFRVLHRDAGVNLKSTRGWWYPCIEASSKTIERRCFVEWILYAIFEVVGLVTVIGGLQGADLPMLSGVLLARWRPNWYPTTIVITLIQILPRYVPVGDNVLWRYFNSFNLPEVYSLFIRFSYRKQIIITSAVCIAWIQIMHGNYSDCPSLNVWCCEIYYMQPIYYKRIKIRGQKILWQYEELFAVWFINYSCVRLNRANAKAF